MVGIRAVACCLALASLGSSYAEARIVCREGYQVVNGQEIATPYCGDNYVAEVARKHGFKVSNEAIRNNPSLKNQVCRYIGSDIRIKHDCDVDHGPDANR
jgi:hypothetical protein